MSFRSLSLAAIALCLAVGACYASTGVDCDAERGICRKRKDGKIQRSVTEIAGGIAAEITSQDPEAAGRIARDLAELTDRLENGQPARTAEPLFAALAAHHREVAMTVTEIEGGVRVTATSKNPAVVAQIRQGANRAVSESGAPKP